MASRANEGSVGIRRYGIPGQIVSRPSSEGSHHRALHPTARVPQLPPGSAGTVCDNPRQPAYAFTKSNR